MNRPLTPLERAFENFKQAKLGLGHAKPDNLWNQFVSEVGAERVEALSHESRRSIQETISHRSS